MRRYVDKVMLWRLINSVSRDAWRETWTVVAELALFEPRCFANGMGWDGMEDVRAQERYGDERIRRRSTQI